jgi:hypothetical protein
MLAALARQSSEPLRLRWNLKWHTPERLPIQSVSFSVSPSLSFEDARILVTKLE